MALGYGGAAVISRALGFPSVITAESVILAFSFSAAVGIIFGLSPAYRASGLDPIEALRRDQAHRQRCPHRRGRGGHRREVLYYENNGVILGQLAAE